MNRRRHSWLATEYQSLSDGLNALESLCAQVLADHNNQQQEEQQEQQEEEEQSSASELRHFLIDAGLTEQHEILSQGLQRLEDMAVQALQQQEQEQQEEQMPTTSSNTQVLTISN